MGRPYPRLSNDALRLLTAYQWPGNVRELRNVLERAVALTDGSILSCDAFSLDDTFGCAGGIGGGDPCDGKARIDMGGGDILYYASRYLEGALGSDRYRAPRVIEDNMRDGRIGLRTGAGFLDYSGVDVDAYREKRLADLVNMLRHFGLARPPVV